MEQELILEVVVAAGTPGHQVVVGEANFTIGRDGSNNLVLADRKASRWHAEIRRVGSGWVLHDLGSANQTQVNSQVVKQHRVQDGDVLVIGHTTLRAQLRTSAAPPPAAETTGEVPTAHASQPRASSGPVKVYVSARRPSCLGQLVSVILLLLLGALVSIWYSGNGKQLWLEVTEWLAPPSTPPRSVAAADKATGRAHDPRVARTSSGAEVEQARLVARADAIGELVTVVLAEARRERDEGILSGAYGLLRVLRQLELTGEAADQLVRFEATLEELTAESWRRARAECDQLRETGNLRRARELLLVHRGALAGTPLVGAVDQELADYARVLTAVEDSPPQPDGAKPTTDEAGARQGDEVPPPPTTLEFTRAELSILIDHVVSLLLRLEFDDAVSAAARALPRVAQESADERWFLAGMPWEPQLFDALCETIRTRARGEDPLRLDVAGVSTAVVDADLNGLSLRLGTGSANKQWSNVSAPDYLKLLMQIQTELGDSAVQVAGAWARRGFVGQARELLATLHEHGGDSREQAEAYLSAWDGLDTPPEGGYVIFRGDIVTSTDRDRIIAEEEAAEVAHRAEMARLETTSPENLPGFLVEYAQQLFRRHHFELGHKVMEFAVAKYGADPRVMAVAATADANAVLLEELFHSWPARQISDPPPGNRLDILIAGDGYELIDRRQQSFSKAADRVIEGFLDHEPFREYASYVNFRKLYCISKDKRISTEYEKHESLFEGFRPRMGGQVEINWGKARGIFNAACPDSWDTALVMVRQGSLGKGLVGGNLCAFQEGAVSIAFHEAGHSLGGLLDEYSTDPYGGRPQTGPPPTGPNLVDSTDLETCPWRHWIEANEPGIGFHEGGAGRPKGVWHPSARGCVMDVGIDFCVVCREQVMLKIYEHVRPVERAEPPVETVIDLVAGKDRSATFKVVLLKPATHALEVTWTVNGQPPRKGRTQPYLNPATGEWTVEARLEYQCFDESIARGGTANNVVTAEVHDPTPWVLKDPRNLLIEEVTWQVHAHPPAAVTTPEAGEEEVEEEEKGK